jgi:CheY-like chemotaxis protein
MDRRRILVIEGERELGEVIRHWLEKGGFDVSVVADSASGLEALYRIRPDLVMTNEHLDQLSRYEFIRKLRQSPDFRDTPILATIKGRCPTGKVVEAGADAVLRVPEDLQNLTPLVKMLLDSKPEQVILQGRQWPGQLPLDKY